MTSPEQSVLDGTSCSGAWINGKLYSGSPGRTEELLDPFSGTVVGHVPRLSASTVDEAVLGAHVRFQEWRATSGHYRSVLLYRLAELIGQSRDELAHLITSEQGKPLSESKSEIDYGASYIRWFAGEAQRIRGETLDGPLKPSTIRVLPVPIGVVAVITPWNFPHAMLARKVGAAFAAGCTVVVKPAPSTPFSAIAFAKLAQEAGFPEGAIQVVTGDAAMIGERLLNSSYVRKLSFTGSTKTGQLLQEMAARRMIRCTLELGGNAPFIVGADADITLAAHDAAVAKLRNAGQTCISPNRFYVHRTVLNPFVAALVKEVQSVRLGSGFAPGTTLGPLGLNSASGRIRGLLEDATACGASLRFGSVPDPSTCLVSPVVISDVSDDMRIAREEIFGPVFSILAWDTIEDVLARANGAEAGLAGYVFGASLGGVAEQLEVGMVGRDTVHLSLPYIPFGGVKLSGYGREGHHLGIKEYQESRCIVQG